MNRFAAFTPSAKRKMPTISWPFARAAFTNWTAESAACSLM